MKPVSQAAFIVLLAMVAAAVSWVVMPPQDRAECEPTKIRQDEICLHAIPKGREVLWIDARSRTEWKKNGLPDSILWNFDASEDFSSMEAEAVMKIFNRPYVVIYCADKGCGTSRKIAEHITNKLQLNAEVHILHDGWLALKAAGMVPDS